MNLQKLTKDELISLVNEIQSSESSLNSNSKLAESILELVHEAIAIVDDKSTVWVNHRTEELTGWKKEELIGENFLRFVHEEDRNLVIENHKKIFSGADNYKRSYKFRIYNKKGEILWLENRPTPYLWKGKKASISFMLNITEQEETLKELKESKFRYESVVQNSLEAIIVMRDFKLIFMNRTTEILYDEKYERLLGSDITKFIFPEDLPKVAEAYRKRLKGEDVENRYVVRMLTSKGKMFYGEITAVILNWEGKPASMSFITDVTDRVLANKKIEILNSQYQTIISNSLEGIFIHFDSQIVFVNQSFADILKKTTNELLGKRINEVVVKEDANLIEYNSLKLMEGESGINSYQVRAYDSDGNLHWLVMRSVSYVWQNNKSILNFVFDITEQKKSERSLLEQNDLLETLINSGTEDIICFLNSDGKIIKANKTFIDFFGLSATSVINRDLLDISIYSPAQKEYFNRLNEVLRHSFFSRKKVRADIELESADGIKHIFDLSIVPLKDRNDEFNGLVFSGRDVTTKRHESKLLKESERNYKNTLHLIKLISDSSPNLIWAKDLDGKYIFTNDKLRKLFLGVDDYRYVLGKDESEFVKEMLEKYNYDENLFSFNQISKSYEDTALKSLEPVTAHVSGNLNGEHYDFSFYIAPLYDADDKLIGTIGTANDITSSIKKDEEIKANEKNFRLLIHNFPLAIIITSRNKILFYNNAFKKLSGYNDDELRNFEFISLVSPTYRADALNFYGSEYNFKAELKSLEFEVITKENQTLTVSANSFRTQWGDKDAVITVLQDITEEKKHLVEILRLSEAIKQSPVGILITDLDDKIVFANPYVADLTGFKLEEILGEDARAFYSDTDACSEIYDALVSGDVWRGEVSKKKKNGDLYWALCTVTPIKNKEGKIINYLYVQFDITKRKKMEEELIKARDKAKKADKLKAEFLTLISHEIRTPINALLSFGGMIRYELGDKIEEDMKFAFTSMENAGKRIIRTIDLILNMSELHTGTYDYSPKEIDILGLLAGVYLESKSAAERKGLELEFEDNLKNETVYKDEYSLKQIFLNLVDNAIKFTDRGKVVIRTNKSSDNRVVVSVSDTGIGISEKSIRNIFLPFSQEDGGYTRKYEGNGLGLSLVKQYVELNKGELFIDSEKGKGSTFTVKF